MNLKQAIIKSLATIKNMLPILIGTLLLVSLLSNIFKDTYKNIFVWNIFFDSIIGALAGSISFGIPATSYIIWKELIEVGISLIPITAFLLAWSTVWIVMLPLEASFLGKKFAIYRNLLNFIFAIIISILTVFTLNFLWIN